MKKQKRKTVNIIQCKKIMQKKRKSQVIPCIVRKTWRTQETLMIMQKDPKTERTQNFGEDKL